MDIISRLKQYMDYCQLTSSQLADTAGIPRPTLSQLLNGRNKSNEGAKKISSDIIRKLHEAYPSLNVMWLLFGDGDMELNENIRFSEPEINHKNEPHSIQEPINQDVQRQIIFDDELPDINSEKIIEPVNANSASFGPQSTPNFDNTPRTAHTAPAQTIPIQPDKTKKVQSIMVFYSDNSFEIFKPSE